MEVTAENFAETILQIYFSDYSIEGDSRNALVTKLASMLREIHEMGVKKGSDETSKKVMNILASNDDTNSMIEIQKVLSKIYGDK